MTQPFPILRDECRDCGIAQAVTVHGVEITHMKESDVRIEGKVDKLIWMTLTAMGASAGTLMVMLLRK